MRVYLKFKELEKEKAELVEYVECYLNGLQGIIKSPTCLKALKMGDVVKCAETVANVKELLRKVNG